MGKRKVVTEYEIWSNNTDRIDATVKNGSHHIDFSMWQKRVDNYITNYNRRQMATGNGKHLSKTNEADRAKAARNLLATPGYAQGDERVAALVRNTIEDFGTEKVNKMREFMGHNKNADMKFASFGANLDVYDKTKYGNPNGRKHIIGVIKTWSAKGQKVVYAVALDDSPKDIIYDVVATTW